MLNASDAKITRIQHEATIPETEHLEAKKDGTERAYDGVNSSETPGRSSRSLAVSAVHIAVASLASVLHIQTHIWLQGIPASLPIEYPACDPSSPPTPPANLPELLKPLLSCNGVVSVTTLLIILHWYCAMELVIREPERWRPYIPGVLLFALSGTSLASLVIKDTAVLFLEIFPSFTDLGLIVCLGIEAA